VFERKKKKIEVPTIETRTVTVPTAQGLKDMITPAVASAAAVAKEYTHEAGKKADDVLEQVKPYFEQGRDIAEKQAAKAKESAETAKKHVGNHDGLSEFLASGAAAREVASQRSHDAALVLSGKATAKPVKKKGGFAKVVVNLGVLTVIGALAAVVVQKLRAPKDDPWARPLTDPYVAPPKGRDASATGGTGVQTTDVTTDATVAAGTETAVGTQTIEAKEGEIITAAGQVPTQDDKQN